MARSLFTQGRLFLLLILAAVPPLAFGQSTFVAPGPYAFPHIAVGGDSAGLHYVTVLQIVNNNSIATNGHFELLSDDGSPAFLLVDGAFPQSVFDVALAPGETRQIELSSNGGVASAWLKVAYTPSQALTAVIIQYRSGTSLRSEVGVDPAFNTLRQADLAFENDATLNTGIALSNPSGGPAYVLARLWDPTTGSFVAGTVVSLAANGHLARFVTELFPGTPNIAQMRARVSLDSCIDSTCSGPGGNGFVATALRLNGDQFTTLAVASRPDGGNLVRVFPQVAFGGPPGGQHMKTVLYFTTSAAAGASGTAEIFDDNGNPLNASADGAAPSSSIPFTVQSNRVARLVLSGDDTLRSGWLRISLSASVNLVTNAVFQTFNGTTLVSEASVPESEPVEKGLIYAKVQPGTNVGVAFANSAPDAATVKAVAFDQQGIVVARRDIVLPANGHLARFVTEIFPELAAFPDFTGSVAVHSDTSFSALALRLTGDKIATLPIAADGMHRPAITALRVTQTQGGPPQVTFSVDLADLDSDVSVTAGSPVLAVGNIDFGGGVVGSGGISLDGTPVLNQASGTLTGTFQPGNVAGTAPPGFQAVFYLLVLDSLGNASNVVSVPFRF
jgi:hypothetical protein